MVTTIISRSRLGMPIESDGFRIAEKSIYYLHFALDPNRIAPPIFNIQLATHQTDPIYL